MPAQSIAPLQGERMLLGAVVLVFALLSIVGITWGLPGREIDKYLFGNDPPWSGEKVYRLSGAGGKIASGRGADVDLDPLYKSGSVPVPLTATEEDIAKIYLRYRLYTYQPDEMITMMALAGMNPRKLGLDPRLYQYGGLFIYPVGMFIGACGLFGLIEVRSDVAYYLDNPDEFGKFYIVARAYAAAWGIVGVICVFAVGRRLGGPRAGLLAALLFTLMPVVICMAHEGKPHLPGAALMLLAVLFAMRHLQEGPARGLKRDWWLMCGSCGAAFGMVLSSWPILVLIPFVAGHAAAFRPAGTSTANAQAFDKPHSLLGGRLRRTLDLAFRPTIEGLAVAAGVYLVTNPYILINAFLNREVLRSNFGNSLAMYDVAHIGQGFLRVVELSVEGATLPVVMLGLAAFAAAVLRGKARVLPLAVPAMVFFLQFVLIGAGKPAEYGRFGIFPNTALAIGASCLLGQRWRGLPRILNGLAAAVVVAWTGFHGAQYLCNFRIDTTVHGSRPRIAEAVWQGGQVLKSDRPSQPEAEPTPLLKVAIVFAEPAPYSCPPFPFNRLSVWLFSDEARARESYPSPAPETLFVRAVEGDAARSLRRRSYARAWIELGTLLVNPGAGYEPPRTPISWANKRFWAEGGNVRNSFDGEADRP